LEGRITSILAEIDMLNEIAREESRGVSGQVSIAATPEFGGLVAQTLFPLLRDRHPDLKLVMRTGYAFEDMQDPNTDLAFRVGTFKDDRLIAQNLGAFRAWLVAAPRLLERWPVEKVADLSDAPCLIFNGNRSSTTWTLFGPDDETPVEVSGSFGVRSFTVLLELALAGHGVAFLPQFMLDDALATGALKRCLPDLTSRPFPVYLTFRPGARRVARLNATISVAEEHIRKLLAEMEAPVRD